MLFELRIVVFGVLIGALLSSIWRIKFSHFEFLSKLRSALKPIEHYHHGLILILLSLYAPYHVSLFLLSLGSYLIIDEANQDRPFAYGKDTFLISTFIGIILLALLIGLYIKGGL